ncbi:MAG: BMP family ABC transporter substrate-binding protein [Verrucomicrobia bacterium]|nr:BMP family ABC transporter substrate-binding protein [Verrucomicrobiota bacterium]
MIRKLLIATAAALAVLRTASADDLKLGFIFVGPKDDYGYNQAHAQGEAGISGLSGVKTVDEAQVPETVAVEETMRDMITQDGVNVLFPTSFGYFDPHIVKLAKEFPKIQFLHCGGLYTEGKTPKNVGSYFGYIDEAEYICGIVAASTSKTGKVGFIAAKPIPQVLRNINSYTLGAQTVNPKISVQVIFTGDWSLPVKEAEAANSLIDQGADVLTCHVDSPKVVVQTAEKRGVFVTGYHADQSAMAPKGYLTGAEWDWSNVYGMYVKLLESGKTLENGGIPHMFRGGLQDGFVKISPYGPAVSDAGKAAAEAAKAKFLAGGMVIYKGPITDNTGKVVIPAGTTMDQKDPRLEKMDYLVAGVVGSTKS